MSAVVVLGGRSVKLADADVLGAGGEGTVYRLGADRAVKVFLAPPSSAKVKKLEAFPRSLAALAVGPDEIALGRDGRPVGYAMRRIDGAIDLARLGSRKHRQGAVSCAEVCAIFARLRERLLAVHRAGVVVGDLNAGNVLVAGGEPHLIDAESMQYAGFACEVAHERTCDPRLYGVDLARAPAFDAGSDWYAFAVLLFSCLLYVHPFGGAHPTLPTLVRRAEARISVLSPVVALPKAAESPDVLPDDLRAWFTRVFEADLRATPPEALLAARWTTCACGVEHARTRCPRCAVVVAPPPPSVTRGSARASLVASAGRGRFVAAASSGGRLAWLVLEGTTLRREDGAALPIAAGPGARFALEGDATWVVQGGRAERARGGRIDLAASVDEAFGEPLFAACAAGAVAVQGGVLSRVATGIRVGSVLAARARVFADGGIGFGAWDVGRAGVSFVFDVARGPLGDADVPPPEGRILDASFVADDSAGLYAREVDASGRVVHELFLIDARGRLLARRCAPADDPVFGAGIGRAVRAGRVLAATLGGLVLCAPDPRGELAIVREFPDTAGLVGPEDALFPAPGGAVYAVGAREIRLVTLDSIR